MILTSERERRPRSGYEAVQLRVTEKYIEKFGELAAAADTIMIVPAGVADIAGMVATALRADQIVE